MSSVRFASLVRTALTVLAPIGMLGLGCSPEPGGADQVVPESTDSTSQALIVNPCATWYSYSADGVYPFQNASTKCQDSANNVGYQTLQVSYSPGGKQIAWAASATSTGGGSTTCSQIYVNAYFYGLNVITAQWDLLQQGTAHGFWEQQPHVCVGPTVRNQLINQPPYDGQYGSYRLNIYKYTVVDANAVASITVSP